MLKKVSEGANCSFYPSKLLLEIEGIIRREFSMACSTTVYMQYSTIVVVV